MYCELHLGVADLCFCGSELAFLYANGKFGPGCFRVVMIEEYTVSISSGIKVTGYQLHGHAVLRT